jgi:hypothetical protein
MAKKPELYLAGPRTGGPSVDDVLRLFTKLTGRTPTAEDVAAVKARLAKKKQCSK